MTAEKFWMRPRMLSRPLQLISGRRDLNPRPLEPHSSALPSCATARFVANYSPTLGKSPPMRTAPKILHPCACGLAFLCVIGLTIRALAINYREQTTITGQLPATEKIRAVRLNQHAFDCARELIKEGHVVADGRGAWNQHQTSAEEENEFIRLHGFGEYAKWHLGIDDTHAENTKQRYKFPYGDFKNVHRCALLAAQSRAGQYQHYDIERAVIELREMIVAENAGHQKP